MVAGPVRRWMLVAAALGAWPVALQAQGRNVLVGPVQPSLRGLSTVGGDLTRYSYGLGGLQRSDYGGGGLLRSSIYSGGGYSLSRTLAPAGMSAGGLSPLGTVRGQDYGSGGLNLRGLAEAMASPGVRRPLEGVPATVNPLAGSLPEQNPAEGMTAEAMASLGPYLSAMGFAGELTGHLDKPVTSLVPSEASLFQANMQRGDTAFRSGQYEDALGDFRVAAIIARRAPEGHLAMVHALFACGQYYTAARDLRDALKYLPELPLVHLQKRVESPPADADLQLLWAYVRYFDGDEAAAAEALRKAAGAAKDPAVQEAIQTFWDGMAAAGKVSGGLGTTQPAGPTSLPATQPAAGKVATDAGTGGAAAGM
jgi:hypothetical protein